MPVPKRSPSSSPLTMILLLALGIPFILTVAGLGVFLVGWWLFFRVAAAPLAGVPNPREVDNPPPMQPQDLKFPPPEVLPLPAPPPEVPGKKTVDLVALIDPGKDTLHGRWEVINHVLSCQDAHFVPRIQIPYQPPQEYDFIAVFSQPALRNGISLVMPKPGGGSFFWYLGGGNGSSYGFASNPNLGGNFPGLIAPNTAFNTTVQVRHDHVKGLLNDRVLVHHQTNFSELTSDHWRQIKDASLLAVACDDVTHFHYLRVIEITGAGKRIR